MNGVNYTVHKRATGQNRRRAGFTLVEAAIVVAIIGIVMAAAVPNITRFFENGRGRAAARSIANALNVARAQAIRTGSNHVVFFSIINGGAAAGDTGGTALTDVSGNPVPVFVLNDGAPGSANQNCLIDAAEERITFAVEPGVGWGSNAAVNPAPDDTVAGLPVDGSSFRAPNGAPNMTWVQFRPDGVPVAIAADCSVGRLGSGGGTIYLQTANRDFAITLSPLGGVRVHVWDAVTAGWTI